MPADASTIALRNELATPSVVPIENVRRGMATARKGFMRISEQASVIQQLLADAEGKEADPYYAQRLESIRQTCMALQREHDRMEECAARFARVLRGATEDFADFVAFVDAGDP